MVTFGSLLAVSCFLLTTEARVVLLTPTLRLDVPDRCVQSSITSVSCTTVTTLDSLMPHPDDCQLFYFCVQPYLPPVCRECPRHLHFNPNLHVCDWPNQAGCKLINSNRTEEPVWNATSTTTPPGPEISSPEPNSNETCEPPGPEHTPTEPGSSELSSPEPLPSTQEHSPPGPSSPEPAQSEALEPDTAPLEPSSPEPAPNEPNSSEPSSPEPIPSETGSPEPSSLAPAPNLETPSTEPELNATSTKGDTLPETETDSSSMPTTSSKMTTTLKSSTTYRPSTTSTTTTTTTTTRTTTTSRPTTKKPWWKWPWWK